MTKLEIVHLRNGFVVTIEHLETVCMATPSRTTHPDSIILRDESVRFFLNRPQRFAVLYTKWGIATWVVPALQVYCLVRSIGKLTIGDWRGSMVFAILAVVVILMFRPLVVGLINSVFAIENECTLAFDGQGFELSHGGNSEYFALGQIRLIRSQPSEFWLVEFEDGRILYVPPDELPQEQVELLRKFRTGPPTTWQKTRSLNDSQGGLVQLREGDSNSITGADNEG